MKLLLAFITFIFLAGCSALGGISDKQVDAVASAGGGCIKVNGVWGSGIIMVGTADKGVIRNGEVTVSGDCGGLSIKDAATVRAVPPVPGTVTTITTPAVSTTTVTPLKPTP